MKKTMMRVVWSLFLTGVVLGSGPCLLSCGPLLIAYVTATKENAFGGLRAYVLFSLTRLFVYLVFGVVVGLFSEVILRQFFESEVFRFIFFAFGLFLCLIGLFLMIERFPFGQRCVCLTQKYFGKSDAGSIIGLGLIAAFSPCLPLLAMMGYIALISDHWSKGVIYMGSFGLGTVLSPLIVFSLGAGGLAKALKTRDRWARYVKILCGAVLFYIGLIIVFLW